MRLHFNKVGLLIFAAALTGQSAAEPHRTTSSTRARYVMGTICELTVYGPAPDLALTEAFEEIEAWDQALSLYKVNSEVSRLNRQAAGKQFHGSHRFQHAVAESLRLARASGGAFDPSVLPLIKMGGSALLAVGHSKVAYDPASGAVSFSAASMGLDFGGIGKGLAIDAAVQALRRRGVTAALVNFGGQLYALGAPPGKEGWAVEIPGAGLVELANFSVSTSGNTERPGHIISPLTGKEISSDRPVTVITPSATDADAWSTALFVLDGRLPAEFSGCAFRQGRLIPSSRSLCDRFKTPKGKNS